MTDPNIPNTGPDGPTIEERIASMEDTPSAPSNGGPNDPNNKPKFKPNIPIIVGIVIGTIAIIAIGVILFMKATADDEPSYDGNGFAQMEQWSADNDNGNRTGVENAVYEITDQIPTAKKIKDEKFKAACVALGDEVDEAKKSPEMPDEKSEEIWRDALDDLSDAVPNCKKQSFEGSSKETFEEWSNYMFDGFDGLIALDQRFEEVKSESGMTTTTIPELTDEMIDELQAEGN